MIMAGDGNTLTGLWFEGQKHISSPLPPECPERYLPVFEETARWLDLYFGGVIPDFTPALNLKGTAFRKAVWKILLTIPYGRTMTYGEIADRIAALCAEPLCFEEILQKLFAEYALTMNFEQYVLVGSTVRSYLAWLKDSGVLSVAFTDNRLLWKQAT